MAAPALGGTCYAREDLDVLTYNVHGINIRETCSRFLRELKRYKTSVAFIQETHFQENRVLPLKDRNYPMGFFSNRPTREYHSSDGYPTRN
ncbi:Hypothetical predicted protein [Pelobates cultripes]|uniref:Endonuclease/exonuclease/phosphatase domain-containing protein n=1 Tax=Pelobates cultripes TaxID=61616 RepID=A0AAD1VQK1_PELCU|nr:Hypothetical predicted protein [Pelobates cultripes]